MAKEKEVKKEVKEKKAEALKPTVYESNNDYDPA